MMVVYSLTLKPRPPYSLGILIRKAPSRRRPSTTSEGYSPVSSIATGSTFSRRNRRSSSWNVLNSGRSSAVAGKGWMWSRRKFPRNSSRRNVRPAHSFSRDSSAIFRDSCSLVARAWVRVGAGPSGWGFVWSLPGYLTATATREGTVPQGDRRDSNPRWRGRRPGHRRLRGQLAPRNSQQEEARLALTG